MAPSLVSIVAFGLVLSVAAFGQVIDVPAGASIQEAIDRAPAGAVLHLPEGVVRESLRITKDITLRSDIENPDRTILEAASPEGGITITGTSSPTVVLEGLTVRGAYGYLPDGLALSAPGHVILRAVHVADCLGHGVALYGGGSHHVGGLHGLGERSLRRLRPGRSGNS